MNSDVLLATLRKLGDDDLLKSTYEKATQERGLTAEVLKRLQEIDRRKLFAARGYSSLFQFCIEYLGYSEGAAQRRVTSARLLNQIPEVEEKIRSGELTLSNISQAQSFFKAEEKASQPLTLAKKREVLQSLQEKSTREAERELLSRSSQPELHARKESIRQITGALTEIKFYADDELLGLIEKVKGLLAHRHPHLSTAELVSVLSKMAIEKLEPKKPSVKTKTVLKPEVAPPKKEPEAEEEETKINSGVDADLSEYRDELPFHPTPGFSAGAGSSSKRSRYIPASVKREVYHRDGGVCTFEDPVTGRKCRSPSALQYDHFKTPFAKGGKNTVEELTLRCQAHNLRGAIEHFGLERIEKHFRKQ